jgi:hypothetical protein
LNLALLYAMHKLSSCVSFTKTDSNDINLFGPVALRLRMDAPLLIRMALENLASSSSFYGSRVNIPLSSTCFIKPFDELSGQDQLQMYWRCDELINLIVQDLGLAPKNHRMKLSYASHANLLQSFSKFLHHSFLFFARVD